MKVTDLLKKQHREVELLFARIEKAQGAGKIPLVRELASKLAGHMRIEEELIYPIVRNIEEDLAMEALEEHTLAAFALKRLADAGVDHETAHAKIKAIKDVIEHHIEEEERTMFPKLDRELDRADSEDLAERCEARLQQIVATGYGGELFPTGDGHRRRARAMRIESRGRA